MRRMPYGPNTGQVEWMVARLDAFEPDDWDALFWGQWEAARAKRNTPVDDLISLARTRSDGEAIVPIRAAIAEGDALCARCHMTMVEVAAVNAATSGRGVKPGSKQHEKLTFDILEMMQVGVRRAIVAVAARPWLTDAEFDATWAYAESTIGLQAGERT